MRVFNVAFAGAAILLGACSNSSSLSSDVESGSEINAEESVAPTGEDVKRALQTAIETASACEARWARWKSLGEELGAALSDINQQAGAMMGSCGPYSSPDCSQRYADWATARTDPLQKAFDRKTSGFPTAVSRVCGEASADAEALQAVAAKVRTYWSLSPTAKTCRDRYSAIARWAELAGNENLARGAEVLREQGQLQGDFIDGKPDCAALLKSARTSVGPDETSSAADSTHNIPEPESEAHYVGNERYRTADGAIGNAQSAIANAQAAIDALEN